GVNLIQFFHIGRILRQSTSNELWNWVVLGGFFVLDVTDQIFKGQAAAFYPSKTHVLPTRKRIHQISRTWRYRYLVWVFLALCLATSIVALVYGVLSGIVGMRKAIDYFPVSSRIPVPWLAGMVSVALIKAFLTHVATLVKVTLQWMALYGMPHIPTEMKPTDFPPSFILITYLASQRTEFQDTNRLLARWIAIT
ncbi:hypothetical protein BT69DRAFT_1306798, partial [Atractiella rhizophila]